MINKNTILFFDMDGTLVDTDFANFLAYKKAILSVTESDHNLIFNPARRFTRSILYKAIPHLTKSDYDKIIQEKEECFQDFLHEIKLKEKNADLLFRYSKTNKTVLVSNCRKERALQTLNYFGLLDQFSYILCRELQYSGKKINKFQNAITKLGISPKLAIAFENEEREIEDARKAGISIINPNYLY